MFTNLWYWFPYVNFLSLSLAPAALIGIDQTLRIPSDFSFNVNTKKSVYDYPEPIKVDEGKDKKELEKVALSTTNKAKARAVAAKDKVNKMEEEAENKEKAEAREKAVQKEPSTYVQQNPGRVLYRQVNHVEFIEGHRYKPIIQRKSGIVFLIDTQPNTAPAESNPSEERKEQVPTAMVPEEPVAQVEASVIQNDDVPHPDDFVYDEDQQLL